MAYPRGAAEPKGGIQRLDLPKSSQAGMAVESEQSLPTTQKAVGTLDLFDFDPVNSRASVGILVDNEYQCQGYGKMALSLLEEYCKEHLSLNQLVATVSIDNKQSLALFRSLCYNEVGVMKWWLKRGHQYYDVVLFQKRI